MACAAAIDFEFFPGEYVPGIECRLDLIHMSDCLGLLMLTIVGIGHYQIKIQEHKNKSKDKGKVTGDLRIPGLMYV